MTKPEEATPSDDRPPRKDHRAVIQANKLRTSLIIKAIQFGNTEPMLPPRTLKTLYASAVIGAIGIVISIGASVILQLIQR